MFVAPPRRDERRGRNFPTMHKRLLLLLLLCSCGPAPLLLAQVPTFTPAAERQTAYQQRRELQQNSPLAGLEFTSIGPTIMSGRVADLAVDPADPTHFYVGYASGGLWETTDNGTSFTPLFDDQPVMTIGDVDVHWPSGTIYVGTGEVNSSRSSYAGNGLYRSSDGGQSWTHLGLDETHHIGRVIVDQDNPDRIWVAALGHLYGANPERGVFLSEDGGASWTKPLFVNNRTGAIDLLRDPRDPDHLYAATWERERRAWDFTESGPGSGIHESSDGGRTWRLISGAGFPSGPGAGRIGLAIGYDTTGRRHLYASIDNYDRRAPTEPKEETITKAMLRDMPTADLLRLENYLLEDFLRGNNFPEDLTAKALRGKLEREEITPQQLTQYLDDANSLLFDTDVKGFEVYQQREDGSWRRTHDDYIDGVYFTYGYYFGQLRTDPNDPTALYALGMPFVKSKDGGATWTGANAANVHADHHALWINPDRPGHLILGNDGGVNISYDDGRTWQKCNVPPLGQYYAVAVDDHPDGYRVYGGLQDNGTWRGPHDYEHDRGWEQNGDYPYQFLFGGDGMQVAVDPRDHETAYVGFQFGNYFRLNPKTGERKYLTPRHELGQRPYRWNWQTPILISPHQPDIFYLGSNHLHRSFNRGDDFRTISPDLTAGGRRGDVPFGTLTTIDESPLRFGWLLTGSDDGRIHLSTDAGTNWRRIDAGLPQELWVSRVAFGKHDTTVIYASLNGYRNDDFRSYVYRSENLGRSWQRIGTDLPAEAVNVVYEDPANRHLLFVGTDHGLYTSLDRGASFTAAATGLPAVAVHDVVVQPTARDLIVGTHGRSLYRAGIGTLQRVAGKTDPGLVLTLPGAIPRYSDGWGKQSFFADDTSPEIRLEAYYGGGAAGAVLRVTTPGGDLLHEHSVDLRPGLTILPYDLRVDPDRTSDYQRWLDDQRKEDERPVRARPADDGVTYLRPGAYTVELRLGDGTTATAELSVK